MKIGLSLLLISVAFSLYVTCSYFVALHPQASDLAALIGSIIGGALGLIALMIAALVTVQSQRELDAEKLESKHKSLLIAIWSELRSAAELTHLFMVDLVQARHGLERGVDDAEADIPTATFRACSILSLDLLKSEMPKVGYFERDIRLSLVNLEFEMRMWRITLPDLIHDGKSMNIEACSRAIEWTSGVLSAMTVARILIARHLDQPDLVRFERSVIDAVADNDWKMIVDKFPGIDREKLCSGIELPHGRPLQR